jgi:hypothetical protein
LFQRYFIERSRSEFIYWGIMVLVFMFFRNNIQTMSTLIVVAGAFYAARFSKEIHHSGNGVAYFMIPATRLEKLTVAIVMTTLFYFSMMMVTYVIGNLLGTALNNLLASIDFLNIHLFKHSTLQWKFFEGINHNLSTNPDITFKINDATATLYGVSFQGKILSFIGFLLSQSLFLLGGIYFKKNQTSKTFLAMILFFIFLSILVITELKLFFGVTYFTVEDSDTINVVFVYIAKIFYCLLPPFFWVVGYFRLTEKQV